MAPGQERHAQIRNDTILSVSMATAHGCHAPVCGLLQVLTQLGATSVRRRRRRRRRRRPVVVVVVLSFVGLWAWCPDLDTMAQAMLLDVLFGARPCSSISLLSSSSSSSSSLSFCRPSIRPRRTIYSISKTLSFSSPSPAPPLCAVGPCSCLACWLCRRRLLEGRTGPCVSAVTKEKE